MLSSNSGGATAAMRNKARRHRCHCHASSARLPSQHHNLEDGWQRHAGVGGGLGGLGGQRASLKGTLRLLDTHCCVNNPRNPSGVSQWAVTLPHRGLRDSRVAESTQQVERLGVLSSISVLATTSRLQMSRYKLLLPVLPRCSAQLSLRHKWS